MNRPKVFGVGLPKTGTTSLGRALEWMGYRVCGGLGQRVRARVESGDPIEAVVPELVEREVERHDAFQDNPWPVLFEEMARRFPDSLFVLTLRPEQEWLASFVRHFGSRHSPLREWIFGAGAPEGNEQAYLDFFRVHYRRVLEHFADQSHRLLVLRLCEGEGWQPLCQFLGQPQPDQPFPHLNSARARAQRQLDQVVDELRRQRRHQSESFS
ncbi:MAG: sulfotransferase family protein [Vulcanimicrobiota bacterium]